MQWYNKKLCQLGVNVRKYTGYYFKLALLAVIRAYKL